MKKSRRAMRMERRHKRNNKKSVLNLTALMDIFTILVFFLMVNQNDVEIPSTDSVELPTSIAENQPNEQLTLLITTTDLVLQGRPITNLANINPEQEIIEVLKEELSYQSRRINKIGSDDGMPITIVGDKNTHYALLKKVMTTCTDAGFNDISLAVTKANVNTGGA